MMSANSQQTAWREYLHSDSLKLALLVGAFLLAGTVAGLVIATGRIILIGLVLGGLLSIILFSMPAIAVWLVLPGTLLISAPLIFHLGLSRFDWLFSVLGFFLLITGLLHGGLSKTKGDAPVAAFIPLSVVFMLFGMLSLMWGSDGIGAGLSAVKRYFQYFGLMYAFAFIPFSKRQIRSWLMLLLIVALFQLPYVLYQRFWVVPNWGLTFDAIIGTFETTQTGVGLSGSLAYLQVAVFAGLLSAWREGMLSGRRLVLLGLLIIAPLLIAEINVIFLALPLAIGVVLLDYIRRKPLVFVGSFAGAILALGLIGSGYLIWQQDASTGSQLTVAEKVENLIEYNFGEQAYGSGNKVGLNRTTVYPFWMKHHGLHNPVELVFGHGIGSTWVTPEGNTSVVNRFGNYNLGLTSASLLLWELGAAGLCLYILMLGSAWKTAYRLQRDAAPGFDRFLARGLLASASLSLLFLFYTDAMVWAPSQETMTGLTLGLLAALARFPKPPKPVASPPPRWRSQETPEAAAPFRPREASPYIRPEPVAPAWSRNAEPYFGTPGGSGNNR
jgi:hypothetical protein